MKKQTYKRIGNCGLFDWEENTAKLDSLGNPLEKLSKVVDFEMFRETLEAGLYKEKLIKKSVTTSAEQHDSVPIKLLIDSDDYGQELYADSAYIGKSVKNLMRRFGMKDRVIQRKVKERTSANGSKRSIGKTPRRVLGWSTCSAFANKVCTGCSAARSV